MDDLEDSYIHNRLAVMPWERPSNFDAEKQERWKAILKRRSGAVYIHPSCFISDKAHVYTTRLDMGEKSTIALGAILRDVIAIGKRSSVGCYSHLAGPIAIGSDVMIANFVSIYGFNHGHSRNDVPMAQQVHTTKGVTIGDDCWIGVNAVILEGVTIGDHSIVAAGAIVTNSCPAFSVVAGNPARIIKSRLGSAFTT